MKKTLFITALLLCLSVAVPALAATSHSVANSRAALLQTRQKQQAAMQASRALQAKYPEAFSAYTAAMKQATKNYNATMKAARDVYKTAMQKAKTDNSKNEATAARLDYRTAGQNAMSVLKSARNAAQAAYKSATGQ